MDVAFHMLSLLHYNLLEVMVLRNKNPPVYAVTFIFILQGTFHYNFTVFFMKCNNIYIYVEFNPVAIFCNVSTQMGIAAKWIRRYYLLKIRTDRQK